MRKAIWTIVVPLMIVACSVSDVTSLISTPQPAPATNTPYVTLTAAPSVTPTLPTPTFTLTPTLIYPNGRPAPSFTPSPAATLWSVPTQTGTLLPTSAVTVVPTVASGPFSSILVPGGQLYWGPCEPASMKVSVKLKEGIHAAGVVMALRLQDSATGYQTDWSTVDMTKEPSGLYS